MQAWGLELACRQLRYVEHKQVSADCERLGGALRTTLGDEGFARAKFSAIPHGGLIILEQVARIFGLDRTRFEPPFPDGTPLIVIDDCALSGARFFQFLRQLDHPAIVFAPLYSHPELRTAIVSRESQVLACLSAQNIAGRHLAEKVSGTDPFYWSGETEAICFPWNEPDRTFWNPVSKRWELAWRIVPPELCLKNRPAPGTVPIPIQLQPEGKGPLRPSERSLFAEIDGSVVLFDLETGQGFSLAGIASDLWRSIVRLGDLDAVVTALAPEYDAPVATLRGDAERFTNDLLARGLLEVRD
jgi:hypothetical protein